MYVYHQAKVTLELMTNHDCGFEIQIQKYQLICSSFGHL